MSGDVAGGDGDANIGSDRVADIRSGGVADIRSGGVPDMSGSVVSVEACEAALDAARELPGAFWQLDEAGARAAAGRVEQRRESGATLPLDGVTLAVKDSFAVAGLPRSLGLAHARRSDEDAAAVARLRDAGAIVLGTTAMDQLAWTMTGRCPGVAPCENPLLPGCSPGGSSAGAAAAVAGGAATLGLGGDSAGSVRLPATWCGVIGFKPTFGSVSLAGCAPLARGFDTVGLIARELDTIAAAYAVLRDGADTTVAAELTLVTEITDVRATADLRIGVPSRMIDAAGCEEAVSVAWQHTRDLLAASFDLGELVHPLSAPGMGKIFGAELAARWSHAVTQQPPELVGPELRSDLPRGAAVSAAAYIEASDALADAKARALAIFDRFDAIALPVAPVLPPPAEQPASVAVASAFTRVWSGFGWPAIAIPLPSTPGAGVQLVGAPDSDEQLLRLARATQDLLLAEARA